LLLAPPLAFLACFFAWPVVNIVGLGLRPDGRWDLHQIGDVLGDDDLRRVAWFTLWQALASTVLTVIVALPAAHVFSRYEFRGRRTAQSLATIPFVLPTVVVGAAFLALLGPRGAMGVRLDGTVWAVLLAHVFFNHAVVVRTVGGLWEGLDPTPVEAARVLGASPWRAWCSVTLPALRPAIQSAALVVFVFTFTSFGIVQMVGGSQHATLEVEIYRQTAQLLDLPVAAVLSLLQVGTVGIVLVVQDRVARRWIGAGSLAVPSRLAVTTTRQRLWVGANLAVLGLFLATPLVVLVERSVRTSSGHGLANWRALGGRTAGSGLFVSPLDAIANSVRFAVVATVLAVGLGALAAVALARSRGRLGRAIDAVLLLPLGTSAVTVGFGFLVALDEPIDLRSSPWLIPIAQAVVALPFTVRTITPVLRSIDPLLREAAGVLGATPWRTWWEVDRLFLRRSIAVAAGFAFAISLGEFGATTVIARADRATVPVVIGRLMGRPGALNSGQAFALASILMVVTGLSVWLVDRRRREVRGAWW
jgi:thiamine transport system permease protein